MLRLVSFNMDYFWACNSRGGEVGTLVPFLSLYLYSVEPGLYFYRKAESQHATSVRRLYVSKLHRLCPLPTALHRWPYSNVQ
jgi:hypothetical protein